ncbi:putative disease resistance protein [Salvia divinorum]|uniref:Disease resistance protein n=1 Tax=Salvia divinorum TaxID=28513 RepID=A0ABD1HXR0_SALDI
MAYNLQTFITILEGILDPDQPRWVVDENNPQLQSLLDKATSLQQLLDESSFTKLDSQIREVAHQAEDIIESHMVDHMLSGSDCVRFTHSTPDLQQVTRDLDSVMERAEKLMEMEDDSAMEQVKLVEMEDKKMPRHSQLVIALPKAFTSATISSFQQHEDFECSLVIQYSFVSSLIWIVLAPYFIYVYVVIS